MPPLCLYLDLPRHVMRNVSRFCLRAHNLHNLTAESSLWRVENGPCDKCSCAAVQSEVHVVFTVKICMCALLSLLITSLFLWRPLIFLQALPSQIVFRFRQFSSVPQTLILHLIHYGLLFGRTSKDEHGRATNQSAYWPRWQ